MGILAADFGGYGPDLLNDVANRYINAINNGFGLIKGDVTFVLILSFKFGSLAAFALVPFAVLSKTAFIAERPLGWVVASGVKLMVLTLVLGVGNGIFQRLRMAPGSTVTTYEAFCIALSALLLMVLSLVASRLASDLIIGGPSLGVGTAAAAVALTYNTTGGALASRPAVLATKAAAAIPTKGATLAWQAGGAALRGAQYLGGMGAAGSNGTGAARRASAVAPSGGNGSRSTAAAGGTALASRISGPIRVSVTRRQPSGGAARPSNVRGLLT